MITINLGMVVIAFVSGLIIGCVLGMILGAWFNHGRKS